MANIETNSIPTTPSTPSRRINKKERLKMISQITILDATMDGQIVISLKIEDCSFVDDSSLSLLSMPDGPFMASEPIKPAFHSFVITVQNGTRIYGGSYIFGLRQVARSQDSDDQKVVYMSRALVAITIRPMVDQLRRLLEWCVHEGGCNPRWLRCLANIYLPQKGKCILIRLPDLKNLKGQNSQTLLHQPDANPITNTPTHPTDDAKQVAIFRPFSIFPLFDYSFRLLLTQVLSIDNLLLLFTCALNEVQILVVGQSYYHLMLVAECVVALLNPFKWQHVYVPILPRKLGLHYLDAPTPFIMGIHSRQMRGHLKANKIACFVDCDEHKVELHVDVTSLFIPPFIEELRTELHDIINADPRLCSSSQKSDALKRVSELAHKYNVISDHFTYLDEIKLNQKVRILFFKKLKKHILNKYQHFIAYVAGRKEQIKFDTVAYLSDQPLIMRPFLQHFVETQMFASFIDEAGKTIAKKQRQNTFVEQNLADSFYLEDEDEIDMTIYSDRMVEARFNTAQHINLFELEDSSNQSLLPVAMSPYKKRIQVNSGAQRLQAKSIPSSPAKMVSTALTAQTNWKVVETLLKEVKNKTKRILLAKMGSDEGTNSTVSPNSNGVYEENTLIAALCDLVERIWAHARSEDFDTNHYWESSKCPFWTHLTVFHDIHPKESEDNDKRLSKLLPKDDSSEFSTEDTWTSLKKRIDSLSQLSLDQDSSMSKNSAFTKSIPSNLAYDFQSICDMTDIKTDVGKSRAFIRLSLERKLLSKHLRTLLYNQELLQSLYKRYAFLRCEEEREQFLTHLLTLNAVDLYCFTNTFTTSAISYSIYISATSQFTGWVAFIGSFEHPLDSIYLEGNQHSFKHTNFGHIFALSLRVPSTQKVFVKQGFVRNNVTNCLYKFECNKWLGKNIDDGSLERLLICQTINGSINDHLKKSPNHLRSSSIGRNWTRGIDNAKEEKHSVEDLQAMLGESVNQIMKLYYSEKIKQLDHSNVESQISQKLHYGARLVNSSTLGKAGKYKHTSSCRNLINLLFGEKKFLWIISQTFYYGFKNRRILTKIYLWDYILRVQCELKHSLVPTEQADFISLVDRITDKASTYGKDMKFQMFILIALRDHKLSPHYLKLLSRPSLAQLYYDNESFIRDGLLFTFLMQILKSFNEIDLKLDTKLTKDI